MIFSLARYTGMPIYERAKVIVAKRAGAKTGLSVFRSFFQALTALH